MEILNKTAYGQPKVGPVDPAEKRSCPRYPFSPEVEVIDMQSHTGLKGPALGYQQERLLRGRDVARERLERTRQRDMLQQLLHGGIAQSSR